MVNLTIGSTLVAFAAVSYTHLWAADLIRGRRWHTSQELTELPSRQIRLRMRLNSIEEAERWVLSWGTHATVVRPQALATRLCSTSVALQDRYRALG